MKTLVQLVHGYPPRELAGTEVYADRVTRGLSARGWQVHVIAATRSPGDAHGESSEEALPTGGRLIRVVNNLPWRPLGQGERDPLIEGAIHDHLRTLVPDVVLVQHLLFLSAHLALPAPSLMVLHDAWGWCPRTTMLRDGERPCPGPDERACLSCMAPLLTASNREHQLGRLAGRIRRFVPAPALHRAWRGVPGGIRARVLSGRPPTAASGDLHTRQDAVKRALQAMDIRVAPSRYLAAQSEQHGMGPTGHLPHGVDPGPPWSGRGPLRFVGSLVPHKGADLVLAAWEQLGRPHPLEIVGPETDPGFAASLPGELRRGPVPNREIPALLADSRALVMGSRWPENAPLLILEARASGCPVVAPRIGGVPELVEDGVDGRLYEPGSVDSLARAITAVLSTPRWSPRPAPTLEAHLERLDRLLVGLSSRSERAAGV